MGHKAVIVTTVHRGVFFGYLVSVGRTDNGRKTALLEKARNCLYWSQEVKGFLGLAATGPGTKCRVGPAVDVELEDVTCVATCSSEAVEKWEAAPWS